MFEPFQSPVLLLAAAALAEAARLAADAFLFPATMVVCRGARRTEEEDDGVERGGKRRDISPLTPIYRKLRVITTVQTFYPSYVSHILATTWRKDTNRQH